MMSVSSLERGGECLKRWNIISKQLVKIKGRNRRNQRRGKINK